MAPLFLEEEEEAVLSLSRTARLGLQMQEALQDIKWTYSIFWQFCEEGLLAWRNGFYNGDIGKRDQVVDDAEIPNEGACRERSLQLRQLFRGLSDRENQGSSTLVPEDLGDVEWFYLLSMSYQFKSSIGLPGLALEMRSPVWLNNASEADSKIFNRYLLAKSSGIKTVVCIPLADGVLEFGNTEQVKHNPELIERIKSFLVDL